MTLSQAGNKERLFDEKTAAQMLCLGFSTLRVLRAQKRISHYQFGRRIAYSTKHIQDFKQRNEQRASA